MNTPNYHVITVQKRAWAVLRTVAGFAQIGAGVGILVNGDRAFASPQFNPHAHLLPWWWWGSVSVVIGVLVLHKRTRLFGLINAALWWMVWSCLLIAGIIIVGQPLASIAAYSVIIVLPWLLAGVEFDRWRQGEG